MKTNALKRFRAKLAANEPVYGLWVTLESASITEMAVALDMDWVVIDAEHGYLDWKEINEHIRAALRSETVLLVRLAERSTSLTKRALDIGADGVVIPWVETVEQLQEAISDARYPTEGRRGIGGERATAWGQCLAEHTAEANEHVLVVPLIESVAAIPNVPAMCEVDGTDVFFFGPADFSATAGYRGQWEGPGVAQQILELKEAIRSAGKHCGVMTTSINNLVDRREQEFHMLGVGADNGLLLRSIHQALQAVDRDRMPTPSLDPADSRERRERPSTPQTIQALHRAPNAAPFRIALTADFYDESGAPRYRDFGLDTFTPHDHIVVSRFAQHQSEIAAEQMVDCHAALVLTPKVTAASLAGNEDLLVISRFGVGYDAVDVHSCTANNVLVTITPGAVDRPVAEATIGWMLALTHRVLQKDRLVRTGHWDERSEHMGCELRDRTLGVVGLGGIGRKLVQLLQGFGMRQPIAFDPLAPSEVFAQLGVRQVELDELLCSADFVSLHCPLNAQTQGLIGAEQLQRMKPNAYLLNLARGGIVDENALFEALASRSIAGAALDCFEQEPVTTPHRLADLDNVLLAPHSIAWTDELFRDIGLSACQSLLDVSLGRHPRGVVNPEVFEQSGFQEKWKRVLSNR